MATVYSTQRTNARAVPSVKNKANELGGRVRVAHGVYEASSLASGDVIEMFILPDGARIISGSLAHDALGSSTTLAVGHGAYNNADGTAVALDADEFKALVRWKTTINQAMWIAYTALVGIIVKLMFWT